ncbi:hypothetical protein [Myxococcus qinghaiensis]|uniref:hypothetical protein n=1 Tax=Myxococcus qinghaiensis TaxID=2906758 RepID=UPI0020A7F85C|nr:hypothetical protein [Myxococcus qinghaiensis]MCP3164943.1 hypothetical protein [Myxococcus qinghaiensis]
MRGLVLLAGLSLPVLAHEGAAHGETVSVSRSDETQHVLSATGDVFEVVLKHPEHSEAAKTPVRLWVADVETNAPVSSAHLELTLTGTTVQTLVPKLQSPGVYVADAELSPGAELAAVVTVTRGNDLDVLALGTVHLSSEHDSADASPGLRGPVGWSATGGIVLLLVAGAWWMNRHKKVRP